MVEAALERLRLERENRAKERNAAAAKLSQPKANLRNGRGGIGGPSISPASDYSGKNGAKAGPPLKPSEIPRQLDPSPSAYRPSQGAVRDGGGIGRRNVPPAGPSAAERRLQEERDRIRAKQDAEDAELAEQRRLQKRESEARQAAAARDSERAAREAVDAQRRERALERQSYLNAERERREREKEELLREKEKLDRIFEEKARSNVDRIQENRRKIEEERVRAHAGAPEFSYQDNGPSVRRDRSEEKSEMSAKEKVLQRKLEKQAREEQEQIDALRRAAEENRRIGAQAHHQFQSQWHDTPLRRGDDENRRGPRDRSPAVTEEKSVNEIYQFESEGRARVRNSNDVNLDEMTARLNEIAPAGRLTTFICNLFI